jgi:hypothetical protein
MRTLGGRKTGSDPIKINYDIKDELQLFYRGINYEIYR